MSTAGIRVYNEDGSLQFDSSSRLFLTLDDFDTGTTSGSRTFSNPGLGTVTTNQIDDGAEGVATPHNVTVSGGTVSWSGGNVSSRVRVMAF